MILKNIEIIEAIKAIKELMKIKLPSKVSWNLNKNLRKLTDVISDFDKFEQELIEEFAKKDESGNIELNEQNQWTIPKDNIRQFNEKRIELFSFENELDVHKIKLSDLENYDIEGEILYALDFMIDEDE